MKKITKTMLAAAAVILMSVGAKATTRTVNNNAPSPGQYTTITAAITAASAGDTILVKSSPTTYGDFNIIKRVHIVGEGWQLPGDETNVGTVTITSINAGAGSIRGIVVNGFFNFSTSYISNYTINKCRIIAGIDFDGLTNDSSFNFIISENHFTPYYSWGINLTNASKFKNLLISNNLFNQVQIAAANSSPFLYPVSIKNNLFTGGAISSNQDYSNDTPNNMVFENNIFYNTTFTSTGNAAFTNNILYSNAGTVTLPSGSVASGNLINVDPLFTAIYNNNSSIDYSPYDGNSSLDIFTLQPGSPADNAGTDGTDIGLTGGLYPLYTEGLTYLTGRPAVPYIQSLQFTGNNATNPGGTLNVQLKAKKVN